MAKKKSNKTWIVILVIVVIVAAIGGMIVKGNSGKKGIEVTTVTAKKGTIVESVSASGKVQPEVEVKISPDVSGEIIQLNVKEGDSVKEGQLLCRIRPDNYLSAVDRASASVNNAKAAQQQIKASLVQSKARLARSQQDYDRNKSLIEQKVIAQSDWEQIVTNLEVAKQDLQSAEANLDASRYTINSAEAGLKDAEENLRKTTIYSPVNGIISKLSIELGERVVGTSQMAGTEIMRIANLNNMEVRVDVNENDIIKIKNGDSAIIDVDAYSITGRKFRGIVTEIANTANVTQTSDAVTEFQVKVRLLSSSYQDLMKTLKGNEKSPFRPGMTASLDIITNRKTDILLVPMAAVTTRLDSVKEDNSTRVVKNGMDGDETKVTDTKKAAANKEIKPSEVVFLINKEGKAEKRKVKTGISDYENIEILEGLKDGEEIISGPFQAVSKDIEADKEVFVKKEEDEKPKKK